MNFELVNSIDIVEVIKKQFTYFSFFFCYLLKKAGITIYLSFSGVKLDIAAYTKRYK